MVSGDPVVERVLESRRTATVDGVTCGLTAIKILSGEAEFSNVERASGCALEAQHNFDGTETTSKGQVAWRQYGADLDSVMVRQGKDVK